MGDVEKTGATQLLPASCRMPLQQCRGTSAASLRRQASETSLSAWGCSGCEGRCPSHALTAGGRGAVSLR